MKWIIYVTIFSGIASIILLIKAIIDGREPEPDNGTFIKFDESDFELGEIFQENDFVDTYSPVRNKIEEEIEDININYNNYKK